MTLHQQKDIVQAAIDGKRIQLKSSTGWLDCEYPVMAFNFHFHEYRVKREPRTWVLEVNSDTNTVMGPWSNCMRKELVRVTEQLD